MQKKQVSMDTVAKHLATNIRKFSECLFDYYKKDYEYLVGYFLDKREPKYDASLFKPDLNNYDTLVRYFFFMCKHITTVCDRELKESETFYNFIDNIAQGIAIISFYMLEMEKVQTITYDGFINVGYENIPYVQLIIMIYKEIIANEKLIIAKEAIQNMFDYLNSIDIKYLFEDKDDYREQVCFFYEYLLGYCNKDLRKQAGVYYTPQPICDFITRSLDYFLKEEFGIQDGFANPEVTVLDFATGTGMFLYSVVDTIIKEKLNKDAHEFATAMINKSPEDQQRIMTALNMFDCVSKFVNFNDKNVVKMINAVYYNNMNS